MLLKSCLGPVLIVGIALCQTRPTIEEQAREILQNALQDKNPDTRKQAAVALSLAGIREPFISQLESMLRDKDVEVRIAAVSSLSQVKTQRAAAALRESLTNDVPEVSFAAAKALWERNDPAGKEALLAVLSGENKISSNYLTKQRRDAIRILHTPKSMFMFALKQGIGFAPVPGLGEGISSMQGLLSDSSVSGRAMAALLLGKDKDRDVLPSLREALGDKDWSVRAAAVHSIALRNDPSLEKDLAPLLSDNKEAVRLRTAAGCLRLEMIRRASASQKKPG
jgi:HEAT repeat protein